MKELILNNGEVNLTISMTTLDIAKLTGKRHDNILRDTRKMFKDLNLDGSKWLKIDYSNLRSVNKAKSGDIKYYYLTKDLLFTLLTGYNTKLRNAVIKRWLELEGKYNAVQINSPNKFNLETNEALYNNGLHKVYD